MSRKINSVKKTKLHNDHKVLAVRGRLSAAVEAGAGQELRLALAGIEEPVQPAGALLRIAAAVQRPLTESLFAKLKTQKKNRKNSANLGRSIARVATRDTHRQTAAVVRRVGEDGGARRLEDLVERQSLRVPRRVARARHHRSVPARILERERPKTTTPCQWEPIPLEDPSD